MSHVRYVLAPCGYLSLDLMIISDAALNALRLPAKEHMPRWNGLVKHVGSHSDRELIRCEVAVVDIVRRNATLHRMMQ